MSSTIILSYYRQVCLQHIASSSFLISPQHLQLVIHGLSPHDVFISKWSLDYHFRQVCLWFISIRLSVCHQLVGFDFLIINLSRATNMLSSSQSSCSSPRYQRFIISDKIVINSSSQYHLDSVFLDIIVFYFKIIWSCLRMLSFTLFGYCHMEIFACHQLILRDNIVMTLSTKDNFCMCVLVVARWLAFHIMMISMLHHSDELVTKFMISLSCKFVSSLSYDYRMTRSCFVGTSPIS